MNFDGSSRRRSLRRSYGALAMAILVLLRFAGPVAWAGGSEKTRTVVVLYPDANDGRPGGALTDRGIRSTFAANARETVEVHSEHLDLSRFADPAYQQRLAEFLRRKYADRKIDLVIAGLASGLDFALKHREQTFPGVPIIYCAVDQREINARKLPADVIGVPIKMDLAATLDIALQFHPTTRRVYVVTGKSKFDVQWEAESRLAFQAYQDKLEFIYLAGLPMPDLLSQVADLPENSIVYFVHVFEDGDGKILIPAEALRLIAAHANAPIYGHVDTYVGRGIVGGRVFSFETAGQETAALGLRVLAGEKPEKIAIRGVSNNTYMFDWRELRRWGISEESLPPGSIVRQHEPGFWDLYRWHILGVLSLCVVEALLIIGLLVQRSSRKRAENRFQQAVEAAPNGMLMIGPDGTIVLVNAEMEKLFGYRKVEMLDQPVEMLLPERLRGQHPEQRNGFFAVPSARPVGAGRELFGRRKDGSEVPVEIGLSPVRTERGPSVLASIIDVTERKRAELALRESESRFGLMADTAPVMVWMSGPDKRCTYFNKTWLDFTGRPLERELGDGWSDGVHPDELPRCLETYVRAFDARQGFHMEYRLRRFDGAYRWIFDAGVPRFNSDGAFEGYIGSCLDVTDQKQAMDDLRQSQAELRELTGRLLQAQETERRRIARDLHDDLSQSLAVLAVELDLLAQKPPEAPAQARERIQALSAQVKQLSSSVHGLSHQLHPAKLEQLGLVTAIIGLGKDLSQGHRTTITVKHQDIPESLPNEIALCLYRIAQECLNNVIKHSGARQAAVELKGANNFIKLRVVDDGNGFEANSSQGKGGLGLVGMRERLRLVHGEIVIDSRPSGTAVEVCVPLSAPAPERIVLKEPRSPVG
jgi:PAS domain S-box-containing protein